MDTHAWPPAAPRRRPSIFARTESVVAVTVAAHGLTAPGAAKLLAARLPRAARAFATGGFEPLPDRLQREADAALVDATAEAHGDHAATIAAALLVALAYRSTGRVAYARVVELELFAALGSGSACDGGLDRRGRGERGG